MRIGSLRGQQGQVRGGREYTGSAKLKTKRGGGKGSTDQAELSGLMGCRLWGRRGGISTAWRPALYSPGSRRPMIHPNSSSGLQQLQEGPVQASGSPLLILLPPIGGN